MTAFEITENDLFDKSSGSKDSKQKEVKKEKPTTLATQGQIDGIKKAFSEEEIKKALSMVKKDKLEELTIYEASSLLKKKQ